MENAIVCVKIESQRSIIPTVFVFGRRKYIGYVRLLKHIHSIYQQGLGSCEEDNFQCPLYEYDQSEAYWCRKSEDSKVTFGRRLKWRCQRLR